MVSPGNLQVAYYQFNLVVAYVTHWKIFHSIQQRFWHCKGINFMETFQDVGSKLNSSITILKQKNNTNRINCRVEKNPNQAKLFFPQKGQKKFTFGCYLYTLGRVPACWLGAGCFPYLLYTLTLVRFSQLHGTSY